MKYLSTKNCIRVWNYDHLPRPIKEWMEREQVTRDDLDWIAMVSSCYKDRWIGWLGEPAFGCCSVKTYAFDEEHNLVFGYHA